MIALALAKFGLHVDQNTWATYAGKLLAVVALIAGGILCPADILYKGFGISLSAAAETRLVWWCVAVGVVSAWWANQKTISVDPESVRQPTGGGMTAGLLLLVGLLLAGASVGCAGALSELKPGPNGYTRPQVVALLTDASWGLQEACSMEWVPAPTCADVLAGLQTAKDVAARADIATLQTDVVAALGRVKVRLAPDSRALPFFTYVIGLLGSSAG